MEKEVLRLFKGFIGSKSEELNVEALKYGLIIPTTASEKIVKEAIKQYGKDGQLWNQTFHKDWKTMAETPLATLIIQQLVHYITTYGFEALGIYNDSTVYIPAEKLEIPELDIEKIKFIAINAYTEAEVAEKLMTLITSGIALSEETVKDVEVLSGMIDKNRFDEVTNREVRTFLYDKYNIMPKDPEAFLRYLIYKLTNATLKIQNVPTYRALSYSNKETALKMLEAYGDYAKLSSIFLRNKNLFLALKNAEDKSKTQKEINHIINRLRKLAEANHRPVKSTLLASLSNATEVDEADLIAALEKVTLFRAVSLMNMLRYRLNGKEDIVYRVRNGKSYVSKIERASNEETLRKAYEIIHKFVVNKLAENIDGKSLYIPKNVIYKAPTSEKQFVNNIPEGSYVELPDDTDLLFGVHWTNLKDGHITHDMWGNVNQNGRVDLDLKMMNNSQCFGWNASWRDEQRDILFSGDVTNAPAPLGATEVFVINHNVRRKAYLVTLNNFTSNSEDVPFEFMVAEGDMKKSYGNNYVVDPNTILTKIDMKITPDNRQITLGMVKADDTTKRFYFGNYGVGASGAVASRNEYTMGALSYMESYNELQITLNELLTEAGAKVCDAPVTTITKAILVYDPITKEPKAELETVTTPVDIDLSLEAIDKESLIKLFC